MLPWSMTQVNVKNLELLFLEDGCPFPQYLVDFVHGRRRWYKSPFKNDNLILILILKAALDLQSFPVISKVSKAPIPCTIAGVVRGIRCCTRYSRCAEPIVYTVP